MKTQDIRQGDVLKLKPDNPYGLEAEKIAVCDLLYRGNYKTPWIIDQQGRAFKPSDFASRVGFLG